MHIEEQVARGLFGGIVVRDLRCPKPDYEVPLFFHRLQAVRGAATFDSGSLTPGAPPFAHTFADEGTFDYFCRFHPMTGRVRVSMGGAAAAAVSILDSPGRFSPENVTIAPGGTVTWTNAGTQAHTVTDSGGAGLDSYAINGRTFVGNTPTIVARTGKRIRWYVFNLDLSAVWHNFHVHGQRWQVGAERMDTRSLGPAESFVADTIVPPVVLLPLEGECGKEHHHKGGGHGEHDCGCGKSMSRKRVQIPLLPRPGGAAGGGHGPGGGHGRAPGHGHRAMATPRARHVRPAEGGSRAAPRQHGSDDHDRSHGPHHPDRPKRVRLQGDFLVHCHAEMHMMEGMAAVVRAIQEVEVTPALEAALGFELPLESDAPCPDVPLHPCGVHGDGSWELLPDSPIFIVHAAVLHTGKVLLWAGTAEVGDPLESRVWDPGTGTMTMQTYTVDLFCAGHAFLPDGRLCVAGGAPAGILRATHIFDPAAETWTRMTDMAQARWYPTVLTLADGRILAASGSGANEIEIYDAAADTWTIVAGATRTFPELYPSLHLLPSGQIFYSRVGWNPADMADAGTKYLTLSGPGTGSWTDLGQQQFYDRQEGMSVIQIDTTVSPPRAAIIVVGGGVSGPATARNAQSAESIDLTAVGPAAAWTRLPDMGFPRTNVNVVLLPDGTLLVIGGQRNGKWATDPGPVFEAEIYDPRTGGWTPTASMAFPRQYHSVAVLLPDGRVLTAGGVDPSGVPERDQRSMEVFSPPYLSTGGRPIISNAPANVAFGAAFDVETPQAASIDSVALLRPASVTHHTDGGQRYIRIPIDARTAGRLTVRAPAHGNIAPPGYYMLFVVDGDGVPSIGGFVRLG